MTRLLAFTFILLGATLASGQASPRSVEALFADVDPRNESLETKVVREWERSGITYRYVFTPHMNHRFMPLFALTNVHYRLPRPEPVPFARPTKTFAISSLLRAATPGQLHDAGVKAADERSLVIDDLSDGWRDWYMLSPENAHHWEYSTRKINDPKWRGRQMIAAVRLNLLPASKLRGGGNRRNWPMRYNLLVTLWENPNGDQTNRARSWSGIRLGLSPSAKAGRLC